MGISLKTVHMEDTHKDYSNLKVSVSFLDDGAKFVQCIWRQNIIRSSLAIYGNACKVFRSISDLNSIWKFSGNQQNLLKVVQKWHIVGGDGAQASPPGGGTWPTFGYWGAAEGLKSWPCLGQKYAKNPTLSRTIASISRPCLGQVTKCTLSGFAGIWTV